MAHHMYEIDDLISNYSGFDKALGHTGSEIEGELWGAVGESGLLALPRRIIETVERTIDATHAEKEALMIGALYILAPRALAWAKEASPSEYDAQTQAVLDELSAHKPGKAASKNVARIMTVVNIGVSTAIYEMMPEEDGRRTVPVELARHFKSQAAKAKKKAFPNLDAPKLEAEHIALTKLYIDNAEKPGRKPTGPKWQY